MEDEVNGRRCCFCYLQARSFGGCEQKQKAQDPFGILIGELLSVRQRSFEQVNQVQSGSFLDYLTIVQQESLHFCDSPFDHQPFALDDAKQHVQIPLLEFLRLPVFD